MKLTVTPNYALTGSYQLAGDKSLSHRAALLGAMAHGVSEIDNFLVAGVTDAMLKAFTVLQVQWKIDADRLTVQGAGLQGWLPSRDALDCGNSATTMRLLAGALAAAGLPAILDGSDSLRRRPMKRIIEPLEQMGAEINASGGCAPLLISARTVPLKGIDYTMPVASAEVKSCVLLAGLAARGVITLREPAPSRDHTERMFRSMGIEIVSDVDEIAGRQTYVTRLYPPDAINLPALKLRLPGDISAAAFLIVAGLITPGSDIVLSHVCLNPTRTGLLDALVSMGAQIEIVPQGEEHGEPVGNIRVRSSSLKATSVSGELVVRMIDEFPAFAVAAAYAYGKTSVCDAEELRHKESDRILALCGELRSLGIRAEEQQDGFVIQGGNQPEGGEVGAHNDHRLAMALSLVGLASKQSVIVHGAEIIAESFPNFIQALNSLGACTSITDQGCNG